MSKNYWQLSFTFSKPNVNITCKNFFGSLAYFIYEDTVGISTKYYLFIVSKVNNTPKANQTVFFISSFNNRINFQAIRNCQGNSISIVSSYIIALQY